MYTLDTYGHRCVYSLIRLSSCRQGPLLLTSIKFNPAWISNRMPIKVWDVINYPFHNVNSAVIEVRKWISNFIQHLTIDVITYLRWDLRQTMFVNGGPVSPVLIIEVDAEKQQCAAHWFEAHGMRNTGSGRKKCIKILIFILHAQWCWIGLQ